MSTSPSNIDKHYVTVVKWKLTFSIYPIMWSFKTQLVVNFYLNLPTIELTRDQIGIFIFNSTSKRKYAAQRNITEKNPQIVYSGRKYKIPSVIPKN